MIPCYLKNCIILCRSWKEQGPISLESYIYYLLNDVNVPTPGFNLSFYVNLDSKVTIRSPDHKELPLCDFPMREVFYLLDVETIVYLFTSVLLENQVLICSSSMYIFLLEIFYQNYMQYLIDFYLLF